MPENTIFQRYGKDQLLVEPWAEGIVRVRYTRNKEFQPFDWALNDRPEVPSARLTRQTDKNEKDTQSLKLKGIEVSLDSSGYLDFYFPGESAPFLREKRSERAFHEGGRSLKPLGGHSFEGRAYFEAQEPEHYWGLGQHQYNAFNQKGLVIPLNQMNTQVTVPFLISSRGYGLFWNNPAVGRVELARNRTCWIADQTQQIDFFVIAGPEPAAILNRYYQITGYPSELPSWATGFWQCKLRYKTQEELLNVAREYKKRRLPLSVIVIDYFHWEKQGIWNFDPRCWPEPEKMVAELKDMGVETMVSVWPTVNPDSPFFEEMSRRGYLLETDRGTNPGMLFSDTYEDGNKYMHFYDATNREAGNFVWDKVKKNYLDRGIKIYWLDACEPEIVPSDIENIRCHEGNGAEVGCLYPFLHEKTFYENMKKNGVAEPLNLCRSAWAGSQKYGAAVWSGDIDSTFKSMEVQIKAGLNMVCSGIPWWTTDIGGFYGGKIEDESFRELILRWFQFSLFCPIFRLHGFRNSWDAKMGGDNEVWSFGEHAYRHIARYLKIREAMRPYIQKEAERTCRQGLPLMRPLFFDFFQDPAVFDIEDQFLFGSEILAAPVYKEGQRERTLYLPKGCSWINAWTGEELDGGQTITAAAPVEESPVFLKEDSALEKIFTEFRTS